MRNSKFFILGMILITGLVNCGRSEKDDGDTQSGDSEASEVFLSDKDFQVEGLTEVKANELDNEMSRNVFESFLHYDPADDEGPEDDSEDGESNLLCGRENPFDEITITGTVGSLIASINTDVSCVEESDGEEDTGIDAKSVRDIKFSFRALLKVTCTGFDFSGWTKDDLMGDASITKLTDCPEYSILSQSRSTNDFTYSLTINDNGETFRSHMVGSSLQMLSDPQGNACRYKIEGGKIEQIGSCIHRDLNISDRESGTKEVEKESTKILQVYKTTGLVAEDGDTNRYYDQGQVEISINDWKAEVELDGQKKVSVEFKNDKTGESIVVE